MKFNCPECGVEWPIHSVGAAADYDGSRDGGIVEPPCDCIGCRSEDEFLYNRYMKDNKLKTAKSLMHKSVQTPFGVLKVGSLHPFGVSISPDGFCPLYAFCWTLTKDWKVIS